MAAIFSRPSLALEKGQSRPWVSPRPRCRSCGAPVVPFLDYGQQPLANGFLAPEGFAAERRFPLRVGFCPKCFLVQLLEQPPAEVLFDDRYAFLTGANAPIRAHCAHLASWLLEEYRPESVLEIGCNDGTLGAALVGQQSGVNSVTGPRFYTGVEPSANVAALAREKGLAVETAFWNVETACRLAAQGLRNVDLIVACHVFTHCPYPGEFLRAVDVLLAPDGVLVLEDPSLDSIVRRGEIDQFYDEHALYVSLPALREVLDHHLFWIEDVRLVDVHGGSHQVVVRRHDWRDEPPGPTGEVERLLQAQRYLTHRCALTALADRAYETIANLRELVRSYRQRGLHVAAYGATSKSTVLFNACAFTPDDVEYISDTTLTKIGLCQPGTHIPVISREEAQQRLPDVWILSAWNWCAHVLEQERDKYHGKWLTWVPSVHTREAES